MALDPALVFPLGYSVLTAFTALFPWCSGDQLGNPRCHVLRAPGRPSSWCRSLVHQPETSLTCLATNSPNTRYLSSSTGSPLTSPSSPSSFLPSASLGPTFTLMGWSSKSGACFQALHGKGAGGDVSRLCLLFQLVQFNLQSIYCILCCGSGVAATSLHRVFQGAAG